MFGENYICDQCLCIHIRVSGEEKTALVLASDPAEFLYQPYREEHWGEDLPDVILCLLFLIYWVMMTNFICCVL